MSPGWWVLLAAVVVAVALALLKQAYDGRFRASRDRHSSDRPGDDRVQLTADELGQDLGELATLVQFSSAFCAPCRATRVMLGQVAAQVPGVRHVEIDAESHLPLVRRLDVLRTPTTLVLDGAGQELTRASGVPRRDQVLAVIPR